MMQFADHRGHQRHGVGLALGQGGDGLGDAVVINGHDADMPCRAGEGQPPAMLVCVALVRNSVCRLESNVFALKMAAGPDFFGCTMKCE